MKKTLAKQSFLILLVLCFTVGHFRSPWVLDYLGAPLFRTSVVFVVMCAMGITLDASSLRRSMKTPQALVIAILINVLLVPLLVIPCWFWLSPDLFGGLMVAALVPCTLASASVWTRKAGGDDAIAMMTTVVTNVGCVMVIPMGLWVIDTIGVLQLAGQADSDPISQLKKLTLIILLPLVLTQVLRRSGMAAWADRHQQSFSRFAQAGILIMVLIGSAKSYSVVSDLLPTESISAVEILATGFAASSVHLTALSVAIMVARWSRLGRAEQIACGISGSQKTLMVGLQIAMDCSVSVLPMLLYHATQLILDTLIVDRWAATDRD